jgi:hypothetical protein
LLFASRDQRGASLALLFDLPHNRLDLLLGNATGVLDEIGGASSARKASYLSMGSAYWLRLHDLSPGPGSIGFIELRLIHGPNLPLHRGTQPQCLPAI